MAWWLVLALPLGAAVAPGSPALASSSSAPALGQGTRRADENDRCVSCHTNVAEDWRASLHAQSFTDVEYTHALEREPLEFCRGCHRPEGPGARTEAMGVSCVTCHVGPDGVVRARHRSGLAPHVVREDATLIEGCRTCHEFDAPVRTFAMQRTESERRALGEPRACVDCHMRRQGGRGTHALLASRDPELLARALTVSFVRRDGQVELTLTPTAEVGHAFPTGDLFRRLVVRVTGADGVARERRLGRVYATTRDERGLLVRTEARDERLQREGVTLAFPVTAGPATFEVRLERAAVPLLWGKEALTRPLSRAPLRESTVVARGAL